ncbi:MAG: hypothetical protein ACN4GG_08625 [Akkermansiaceae bacterium]
MFTAAVVFGPEEPEDANIAAELGVGELTREFEDFAFWNGMIGKECSFLSLFLSKRYAEQDEKDGE